MRTPWVIDGNSLASVIVRGQAPGMAKLMKEKSGFAFASRTAWRSEPLPLSLALVTTNVVGTVSSTTAS